MSSWELSRGDFMKDSEMLRFARSDDLHVEPDYVGVAQKFRYF